MLTALNSLTKNIEKINGLLVLQMKGVGQLWLEMFHEGNVSFVMYIYYMF